MLLKEKNGLKIKEKKSKACWLRGFKNKKWKQLKEMETIAFKRNKQKNNSFKKIIIRIIRKKRKNEEKAVGNSDKTDF